MRTRVLALLLGTAAAIVLLFLLRDLPWPVRAFTVFLLVPMPALALNQAHALKRLDPHNLPRAGLYASSVVTLWLLAGGMVVAAAYGRFTPRLIGLTWLRADLLLAWTVFALGAALALYALGRYFGLTESHLLMHLLPQTAREKFAFVFLSITAGICEELVFRGFLISALTVTWGTAAALVISSALFGLLHAYQGAAGALRAGALGLALAIPFILSGSLLPSIAAHTLIDLIGGLWLVRHLDPAHGLQVDTIG
ncbi:MAG: lysostaphin resistance A-like protein [Longimicrobiales bacterium]